MSEPSSLVVSCPIAPQALQGYLNASLQTPNQFADWGALGVSLTGEDFSLARRVSTRPPRAYLREIRKFSRLDYGWQFRYDETSQIMTIVALLWSENWREILAGLHVLRQLSGYSAGSGFVLVHNYVFEPNETAAFASISGRASLILAGSSPQAQAAVETFAPAAADMIARVDSAHVAGQKPASTAVHPDQSSEWLGD